MQPIKTLKTASYRFFLAISLILIMLFGDVKPNIDFFTQNSTIKINAGALFINDSGSQMNPIIGTLSLAFPECLTGNPIFFDNGVLSDGVFSANFTGTYDPLSTQTILLVGGGSSFNVTLPGVISQTIGIQGIGNTIEGIPLFRTPDAIVLGPTSTTVSIAQSLADVPAGTIIAIRDLFSGLYATLGGENTPGYTPPSTEWFAPTALSLSEASLFEVVMSGTAYGFRELSTGLNMQSLPPLSTPPANYPTWVVALAANDSFTGIPNFSGNNQRWSFSIVDGVAQFLNLETMGYLTNASGAGVFRTGAVVTPFASSDLSEFQVVILTAYSASESAVTMAILNDLNQNIVLASDVDLGADLTLGDNVILSGPGTVNFNGFNLILGKKELTWTDTLLLVDADNLVLNSQNNIYGQWIFSGDAQIVGNNFTLNLTSTANDNGGVYEPKLRVKSGTTLRMSNLIVSGLHTGQIVLDDPTATLELFNVVFEMDGNCTFTTGLWHAIGPTTVITSDNFLNFDQKSTLSVDETTVYYDTLNYLDQNNITFGSLANNVAYVNGGRIKIVQALNVGDFRFSYNGNTNQQLDSDFFVSALRRLIFDTSVTVNGAGFYYQFARNPNETILFVEPGVIAEFTDILLQDFPTGNLSVDPTAQLIFGDQTQIQLGESGIVTTTWFFEGQTVMNGAGKILQLGTGGSLVLRPGSSLLLDNMTIRGVTGNNIRCMDNRCTLSIGDVIWVQTANYTFTQSCIDVIGTWDLTGSYTFDYTSACTSHITNFGTMIVDNNMTFYYNVPVPNRDLIAMDTSFSQLYLNGGTLASTTTGMRLTTGLLLVDGYSYLRNDGAIANSQGFSFGNGNPAQDLTVQIGTSATIDLLSGKLVYANQI